jgi:hypothetical protein
VAGIGAPGQGRLGRKTQRQSRRQCQQRQKRQTEKRQAGSLAPSPGENFRKHRRQQHPNQRQSFARSGDAGALMGRGPQFRAPGLVADARDAEPEVNQNQGTGQPQAEP